MKRVWTAVGKEADFQEQLRTVSVGTGKAIVGKVEGRLAAFSAKCPHAGVILDRAEIDGAILTCPLHAWRFDLSNAGIEVHGFGELPQHDLKVENGVVYIGL
jgi:nitrite reductase/ring-hydroxylating ferredoxin subunit